MRVALCCYGIHSSLLLVSPHKGPVDFESSELGTGLHTYCNNIDHPEQDQLPECRGTLPKKEGIFVTG